MRCRPFGTLDFQVSALGFGCMRLPTVDGGIDEPLAVEMLRYAIDRGVNYIDTAHPYHGGHSEGLVAKALAGGYREKVKVATKLPSWAVRKADDFDRFFDEQCERLETDFIDFYLLHNLQGPFWAQVRDLGALDWLDRLLADGRVGHVGFSFHDSFDLFVEVLDAYDEWTLCQIQYNYMNEEVQAGTRGLELAAERGLAVVVMEPLLGGCLARAPEAVQAIWDAAPVQRSPVAWALDWLWQQPEVSVVLSGMSAMAHVVENVALAEESAVGVLTEAELDCVAEVQKHFESLHVIPCTRCGYCMPCPHGVDIPLNIQLYNDAVVFEGNQAGLNRNIYHCQREGVRASSCTACKTCEAACPQHIPVSDWMPRIAARFAK